jgi:cell volume regulation protein A
MGVLAEVNVTLLIGTALLLAGIASSLLASRFGTPLLLVFLVIGMLAGEDGPLGITFSDFRLAYLVGSIALALILFDGGLRTRSSWFRGVLAPAVLLATLGVLVTAAVTAAIAWAVVGIPPQPALLIGTIVASTDAAAVLFLLQTGGLRLRGRVRHLLEVESGTNDPVAVFLTLALVHGLTSGGAAPLEIALELARQAVVGTFLGLGGGLVLVVAINRLPFPQGLLPPLAATGAVLLFALTALAGGSGFLAVYLAGLVVGNVRIRAGASVLDFHDAITWLCQIGMFLLLGLLVTPSRLPGVIVAGVVVALGLMLVARPLAVALCLAPFRFSWRETMFVSWVGLRGAVAVFLASVPVLVGLPGGTIYFDIAFFVVLVSLTVQGWTVAWSARRLQVTLPGTDPMPRRVELDLPGQLEQELVGYHLVKSSPYLAHRTTPGWAKLLLIVRDGQILTPEEAGPAQANDHVYLLSPPDRATLLDRLFGERTDTIADDSAFFGDFVIDGAATCGSVALFYGQTIRPDESEQTVADRFTAELGRAPLVGDRVELGALELIAREIVDGRVRRAGLRIDPAPRRTGWLGRLRRRVQRLIGPG